MNRLSISVAALATATLLANCGGGGNPTTTGRAFGDIAVPTITAGVSYSFDLGTVVNGKYYVTDRNNKAVDMLDLSTLTLSLITGSGANAFAGCSPTANCNAANNGKSGPDGINYIAPLNQFYVGDVNSVKVIDAATSTVVKTIIVGNQGFRADEGCFDPDHNLYMISIPDADQPYAAFINVNTQTVIATVNWVDTDGNAAGGNEQCQYDHATQTFIVNNDATLANPHGEVDVFAAAPIAALPAGTVKGFLTLAGLKRYPLGNCDPTGLALGAGREMAVECRPGDKGVALTTLIVNRDTGAIVATVPIGGGDQVAYDDVRNLYYVAASRWHASGVNDQGGGCSANNVCTPVVAMINAATHEIILTQATGNNAHSVAVDPVSGNVFVPYSSSTNPAGCGTCAANGYVNGGISIFKFG